MAEVAASMLVGPLVAMVKEKASSFLLDQYKVMEGMEQQHNILQLKLPAILDVITDAEQAASQRAGVKVWLAKLKTVAYQANEVFDEFKYEALRRQAKKKGHYSELGFDVVKLFLTHNRFVFRIKMGKKLRSIVQAIDDLVAQMILFEFKSQQQAPASNQWRQTDSIIVDPENIASRSRDEEKQQIVRRVIDPANTANLMVLPIVGMGGLGKTTLAQLIYNDPAVQKHFQLKRWVCVSDDFDAYVLARKICLNHGEKDNAQALLKLQEELSGKRYLVVLDDVWNRDPDKWEKLKACLQHGGAGSVVLVTARHNEIAQLMHTAEAHDIKNLDKEFMKEIIEKRAFSLQQSEPAPELLAMVDEFADICAGSPLAAKALGSVLRTKTSPEEWKAVLKKSNICNKETEIFPILKLSYDDLSSDMKQCFAFCAVFPKDYEIDVEKLIQLWIAHGFIQEQKEVRPETIAKNIFNELASRSFFQDVKQVRVMGIERIGGYYCRNICKIHDLMHDVALSIMEKECALATDQQSQIECDITTVEPSQIEWLTDTTRHLFLPRQIPGFILGIILDNSLAKRSPSIKTLLCDSYMGGSSLQHSLKYSSLQALQLRGCDSSFPLRPKHLHHLRYLDLSRSYIKALPEDISILYNLQTLDLSGCESLRALPRQMKYMTALRHLYTHGCPELKSMPPGLRKLTSLQTLTCFVAGTGSGCSNVGELKSLNLGGHLELCQIENVTKEDAKEANLGQKKELRELTLKWTVGCEDDAKVLEQLEPHDGLQAIRIDSYGGTTFPTWMAMLRSMVEIHIFHCGNLQCFFKSNTSFTFPKLKELTLEGLRCLERWWEINNGGQGEEIMFPQLEKLSIIDCGKLTALPEAALISESYGTMVWSAFPALKVLNLENLESLRRLEAVEGTQREHIMFPQLEELSVENCPVLIALSGGPFPTLKILELKHLMGLQRLEAVEGTQREHIMFPQLEELSIWNCPVLIALSEPPFPALKVLKLKELDSFRRLEAVEGIQGQHIIFPQLKELSIKQCPVLIALSEPPFPALKVLNLKDLESFRRLEAVEGTQGEHIMFPQLEELSIKECRVLIALSETPFPALKILELKYLMSLQRWDAVEGTQRQEIMFPELEKLLILGCGELTALPGRPTFPKLENVRIEGCPKLKTPVEVEAPKLNVLEMKGREEQMFPWVARDMASLTNLKLESNDTETTWAAAEHSLSEVVDGKGKWNHDFPLVVMELRRLKSGVTELCACFVQLQDLKIWGCDALIHWPEREFQSLVSLRKLEIRWCKNLTGYAEAPPEPSTSSEMGPLLPSLESLWIWECESLVEVFNVPASLRRMKIEFGSQLESIYGRRLQQGKSASSMLEGSSVSEVSSSAAGARPEHFLLPCLEDLQIRWCDSLTGALALPPSLKVLGIDGCGGLTGALDLPPSLKELSIWGCDGLRSLESRTRELPSLERLYLRVCKTLSSLPDGPQAYSSLRILWISDCPGIKTLPTCLQQRLGSLEDKDLDARYEEGPSLWKPKTWKYVIRRD